MKETKYKMESVLRDRISGFTGVVLGITFYDTGCIHYGLAPKKLKKDGTIHDWAWFDESRVELVKPPKGRKSAVSTSGPDMNPTCR